MEPFDDIPSPIDLRDPVDARTWVREADVKRPWRVDFRCAIAELLKASRLPARRMLEIGSGPGLLADEILNTCVVESYTLFDFSPPMLELSRERVGHHPSTTFVLGNFKRPDWTRALATPFDAVIAMQSVHEIRHKLHVPALYRQIHDILRPDGLLLVCDHAPAVMSERQLGLHSTEQEQHDALAGAGFIDVATHRSVNGLYLCSGHRPAEG